MQVITLAQPQHQLKGFIIMGTSKRAQRTSTSTTSTAPVATAPATVAAPVAAPVTPALPAPAAKRTIQKNRVTQNGVTAPSAGGKCAAIWAFVQGASTLPTVAQVKAFALANGYNSTNAQIEYYNCRKFMGVRGRVAAPAAPAAQA